MIGAVEALLYASLVPAFIGWVSFLVKTDEVMAPSGTWRGWIVALVTVTIALWATALTVWCAMHLRVV